MTGYAHEVRQGVGDRVWNPHNLPKGYHAPPGAPSFTRQAAVMMMRAAPEATRDRALPEAKGCHTGLGVGCVSGGPLTSCCGRRCRDETCGH